jgi:peptidoglycan-associated lipoprotein
MKRFVLAAAVVAMLSACGSSVKLDDVPVEDKTGAAVGNNASAATTANGASVGKGGVTTVDLSKNTTDAAIQAMTRVVYFDYDSFVVRPEFQSVIEAHARLLKGEKARKVVIGGHTDERGGREYNLALGQKRAEAVRQALSLQGVAESQLEAVSFGKEKPADSGTSEAALSKNRRAEISYR